jgi:poly(U)-specific endoribonuclease
VLSRAHRKANGGDLEKFSHLGLTIWVNDSRAGASVTLILVADSPQMKSMWCSGLQALLNPAPAGSVSLVPKAERPKEKWGVEIKIRNFVKVALSELNKAKDSLTDGEGDDWQELLQWLNGMTMALRNSADQASPFLKRLMKSTLDEVWDINKCQPGPGLKPGAEGIDLVQKTLMKMLTEAVPEPPERIAAPPSHATPKAHTRPANIRGMSMQAALTKMWELDKPNRVEWGDEGFTLDMGSKGKYERDTCPNPLVEWVNKDNKFWSSPVTTSFIALLDNYEREVGRQENITAEERTEMAKFKREVCKTDVMEFLFNYLRANGKDPRCKELRRLSDLVRLVPLCCLLSPCNLFVRTASGLGDLAESCRVQETLIFNLWLKPYRRVVNNDSSGFEHVFVGEEKDGKITGLHNWIQYYIEEAKGNIDYLGWVGKQDSDYDDDVNIVTVKFAWQDDDPDVEVKPMSTILFGSTVEFEIAALTMAFMCGDQNGKNHFTLGSEKISIQCYAKNNRIGGSQIMTAYMELA